MKKNNEEKKGTIDDLIRSLNKEFGDGSSVRLGDIPKSSVDVIPTGSIGLDKALGVGGLPRGRIVEIFGPESSGKTTLALNVINQVQKSGGNAAFIDVEHSLDPQYCEKLGVDVKKLIISQPDSGEEALNLLQKYVESGLMDVVVVDSVAALVPMTEVEGDVGTQTIGLKARMMSQALRKITPVTSKSKTIVIFINQLRMKIGGVTWGSPETTPGGMALKYHCSVRLDIRRIQAVKDKDEQVTGGRIRVKVVKNKVSAPFKFAEFVLMFGEGIDKELELLELALLLKIVEKDGNTYFYKKQKLGVGLNASKLFLKDNPAIFNEILEVVKSEKLVQKSEASE